MRTSAIRVTIFVASLLLPAVASADADALKAFVEGKTLSLAQNQQLQILQLQQELHQLRQDHETGKVAANLMNQLIENGLVQHNGDDSFVVHGSHGDREFSSKQKPGDDKDRSL